MLRSTCVASLLVTLACSSPSHTGTTPDGGGSGGKATTLATVTPGRLAAAGNCIAIASAHAIACVPLAGGAPSPLAALTGAAVEPIGAGSDFVVTSVPDDFGPADAMMELDRVAADGTVTKLLTTAAGAGAGEGLAVSGSNVVFTTGGDAELDIVPIAGGSASNQSFDSGNFGSVAMVGTTAYYVNAPSIHSHDLSGSAADPGADPIVGTASFETALLASDGTTVVAAGMSLGGGATTVITIPPGPTIAPLAAPGGRLSVADGTAYVIAAADLIAIDLATGAEATIVAGEQPIDVLALPDQLLWITADGRLRAMPR